MRALRLLRVASHVCVPTVQYEMCQPDDPMCAMMECSHSMTSFKQRAEQVHAGKVLQLMADISNGKVDICSFSLNCMAAFNFFLYPLNWMAAFNFIQQQL